MSEAKATFSLTSVIDAIESASDECRWFANIKTGEIDCLFDALVFGKNEYDENAFEGDEWLPLPDRYDRNDWNTMRDFSYALGGAEGEELLDAIHVSGAFRLFKREAGRIGVLKSWYAYNDQRIYELAVEWLDRNDCPYDDDRHESRKRDWHELLPDALRTQLELTLLAYELSVCKFADLPSQMLQEGFFFLARTEDELSVVCETEKVPERPLAREDGWRAFMVDGQLDFAIVGILAKVSSALADEGVPLFAVSTFNTDYILVKESNLHTAISALRSSRCNVHE